MRFFIRERVNIMGNYDFQNDFQNDAARKNYDAAMEGKTRKGVDFFQKPLTWEEENPVHPTVDKPIINIVPIPDIGAPDFKSYSLFKKILVIAGIILGIAAFGYIAVSCIMEGGFRYFGFQGNHFW